MIKLKLTITVEYEAEPEYYETDDPVKMAALDQSNFRDDPEYLMGLIDSKDTITTITVSPSKRTIRKDK